MHHPDSPDYRRLFIAIALAAALLTGWQVFYQAPQKQKLAKIYSEQAKIHAEQQNQYALKNAPSLDNEENPALTREQRLALSARIKINSPKLHGSIALSGARFDDLTLAKYRETLEKDSKEVTLLSPAGDEHAYFTQIGWVSPDGKTAVPAQKTLWQADHNILSPEKPVTLSWDNGQGVIFRLKISLDNDYMFAIEQSVENRSGNSVQLVPYGYVNRAFTMPKNSNMLLHEGPMGVVDGALKEIHYDALHTEGNQTFDNSSGWFGISDKYWLAALIPAQQQFKTTYSYYQKAGIDRYQVDYIGDAASIARGETHTNPMRLFAGAKEIKPLDRYTLGDEKNPPIALFDRAVDFGMLYFLTKPLFLLLNFFNDHIGNFGLAIMLLVIVVKLCMYPLANKSYKATHEMRKLQPEMTALKERHGDDRMTFQKELMAMYKREKVNPAAGCLPLIIQMPVFFALYKVLFVAIEMRHAPFFGWLKDLSARDPSNIFTLFGYADWPHPAFLSLGVLPILMCITMVTQMRQQPAPTDPVQAKMMKLMPYFFLFIFASFPAGLVLYWTWSNILSILQQHVISTRHSNKKKS